MLIKGMHHVSMKCVTDEDYSRVKAFYAGVLALPIVREWPNGMMLDTGSGLIEIFRDGEHPMEKGVIRHFALGTDDVDACICAVTQAGYPIILDPKEAVITPTYRAKVAFCRGPLGEEVEFFQELQ